MDALYRADIADTDGGDGRGAVLALEGETPGETVALIEYLLAICYISGIRPENVVEWREWVEERRPLDDAAKWLERQPDRHWDLFDPEEPLGQNARLAPYIDERGAGPAQLVIEHVGDYNQFFDHHHLEHPVPLPADAAFRAMLTQHAYGPGGRARISGKETLGPTLTNLAVGRLVGRVRVLALGDSLGDTLRLNMVPKDSIPGKEPVEDHFNRTWKVSPRPRRDFATKPPGRPLNGPADLNTVLGRSILLRPARDSEGRVVVDRVLVAAGEILEPPPAAFLQDAVYVTGTGGASKPLWPSASRALWRDAHALYAAVADRARPRDLYDRIARLAPRRLHLRAVGLITKQSSAQMWVCGTFPFIPGREHELRHAAERASGIAEYVAMSLSRAAYAAWKIAYPNPKPSDKKQQLARFDARPEHWMHADDPFHLLLERVTQEREEAVTRTALCVYAATLARSADHFLRQKLGSLPANSRGFQARADALAALERHLAGDQAPPELRGDVI